MAMTLISYILCLIMTSISQECIFLFVNCTTLCTCSSHSISEDHEFACIEAISHLPQGSCVNKGNSAHDKLMQYVSRGLALVKGTHFLTSIESSIFQ